MTAIDLTGSITRPLTHVALYGLATILDDAGAADVRVSITDTETPAARLDVAASEGDVGELIVRHAADRAVGSWVTATVTHEGRIGTGTMSPRLKPASSAAAWRALQVERHLELDRLMAERSFVDLRMLGGLGEPGYWLSDNQRVQPDRGASRWEMKTRNKGEEFVGNRLAPLATAVAGRSADAVLDGLSGRARIDIGKDSSDSRTATGFAPPGPVDVALAWCALWGLTALPVVHASGRSRTPGAHPPRRIHPDVMVLPVFTRPVGVQRVRSVLRSADFDRVTAGLAASLNAEVDNRWLVEHDVRAVVRFPVEIAGSASAPERRVLDGDVVVLAQR